MTVQIKNDGGKVSVLSPYHPDFVAAARRLNGKWNSPYWNFDIRDEQRVRDACLRVYGTDGSKVETVDIKMEVTQSSNNPLFAYGRMVVERRGRDSRVSLGDGVVILEGNFPSSCGSSKYPALTNGEPVVLEIRDVPVSLVK